MRDVWALNNVYIPLGASNLLSIGTLDKMKNLFMTTYSNNLITQAEIVLQFQSPYPRVVLMCDRCLSSHWPGHVHSSFVYNKCSGASGGSD